MELIATKPRLPKTQVGPAWATDEFFNEAILEFKLECLFVPRRVTENVEFRLRKGFGTACWTFKDNKHYVFLGTGILRNEREDTKRLTEASAKEYLKKFLAHEYGHALSTLRNFESFLRRLNRAQIPFSLWNLFEDARIESLQRTENFIKFEWERFETLSARETPSALFFLLVQSEHAVAKSARLCFQADPTGQLHDLFQRVLPYYQAALEAKTSTDLYPLLKRWVEEFPEELVTSDASGKGEGLQDLALSFELMDNDKLFMDFIATSQNPEEPPEGTAQEMPDIVLNLTPDDKERTFNEINFLEGCQEKDFGVDGTRVSKVAETLKRQLSETPTKRFLPTPAKRFNARRDLLELPAYRHDPKTMKPQLNVLIFLDCSGSMQGKPMNEAKILIGALSLLAAHKRLTGYLVLSASVNRTFSYHRFKFPLSAGEIANIHAMNGGEGLEATMMNPAHLSLAAKAKQVYVITDADLSDKALNKQVLNAHGVYTTGIYVGGKGNLEKMNMYFDSFLVRGSIEELVQALLTKVR